MKYAFNSRTALAGTVSREADGHVWRCGDRTGRGFPTSEAAMVDAVRALNSAVSFKMLEG